MDTLELLQAINAGKELEERIYIDPHVCYGQPCIKGTKIVVCQVLELLETELDADKIIHEHYPQLDKQDIKACQHYAASLIRRAVIVPFERRWLLTDKLGELAWGNKVLYVTEE